MSCTSPYHRNYHEKLEKHFQLTDEEFEKQFESCKLEPSFFTHEAHIRLAWIHLGKYSEEIAAENICKQILNFDRIHGDGNKFNKGVTEASVKTVSHFKAKSASTTFEGFIKEFPELKTNLKELLHLSK
ncbi:hypothetical protein GGR42_000172 [Saonia flava]|uniref:Uncharacterized protein n=1 Tax=Saonia flava TaxID=523696 RepID=A0A846QRV8_9FLAO|nr:hypothetical protein [Saonia flava]NJB69710.1 hypothetical protein [Saonia flava]